MKRGDQVRDFQGAIEGCGYGVVEKLLPNNWATVRFANCVADLPVSHLEVVEQHSVKVGATAPTVIVHYTNANGDTTTFGPFASFDDANTWVSGVIFEQKDGHFNIDRLATPTTWDSKS